MFYSFNENSIVEYSKRYSERIARSKANLSELKNSPSFSAIYSLLFEKRDFNFFNGDSLYLEGSDPLVSFGFVYNILNKKTFASEPWYVVMDQCADFFDLYKGTIQNRLEFVATNKLINASNYIIPLFIIFFECRNIFSIFTPALLIIDGQIVFRFECDKTKINNLLLINNSITYQFLVNKLNLEDKEVVDFILQNELEIERRDTIITIRKRLYTVKHFDKKTKILDYIKAKQIVSAQELAEYFKLTKRMINYYIAELINEGKVIRVGEVNSSNAKYRINPENYYI